MRRKETKRNEMSGHLSVNWHISQFLWDPVSPLDPKRPKAKGTLKIAVAAHRLFSTIRASTSSVETSDRGLLSQPLKRYSPSTRTGTRSCSVAGKTTTCNVEVRFSMGAVFIHESRRRTVYSFTSIARSKTPIRYHYNQILSQIRHG